MKKEITKTVENNNKLNNSNMKNQVEKMTRAELKAVKETTVKSMTMKAQVMNVESNQCTISEQEWKFCLLTNNRKIDDRRVVEFTQLIHADKYDATQSIVTIKAEELVGKCDLIDLEGNSIEKDSAKEYLVVLDGQHRVSAFSRLNNTRAREDQLTILTVYIKSGIENVGEYLASLNMVGKSWSSSDKISVAAISTGNAVMKKIDELIKKGFNGSTAVLICIGKKISPAKLRAMLEKGDTSFLDDINSEEMIARADKFVTEGMSVEGMTTKILTKRYFITGFNNFAKAHNDSKAFEALSKLKLEDFANIREYNQTDFIERLKNAINA